MNVAAYIRVSTKNQVNGLEVQTQLLKEYCNRNGYNLVKIYSDTATSGTKLKTKRALLELLEDSKGTEFEGVIVASSGTVVSKDEELSELIETLQNNNKIYTFWRQEMN